MDTNYSFGSTAHALAIYRANDPKADRFCICGCGHAVKGMYKPGHDAKHVSILIAEIQVELTTPAEAIAQMPTPNMHNKLVQAMRNIGYRWNAADRVWNYHPTKPEHCKETK